MDVRVLIVEVRTLLRRILRRRSFLLLLLRCYSPDLHLPNLQHVRSRLPCSRGAICAMLKNFCDEGEKVVICSTYIRTSPQSRNNTRLEIKEVLVRKMHL